jgi:hypothetical protein
MKESTNLELKQHHRGRPRTRSAAGRPTKYTQELGIEICKSLRLGLPITTTAQYHRLAPQTLQEWINRGFNGDPEFEEFAFDVDRSRAGFVRDNLEVIARTAKSGKGNSWIAGAWLCERCVPDQPYAIQKTKVEVTGDLTVKDASLKAAEDRAIAERMVTGPTPLAVTESSEE